MGGGGHKAHESFVVAPATAAPAVPEGLEPISAEAFDDVAAPSGAAATAVAGFEAALAKVPAPGGDVAESYEALKDAAGEASGHLAEAAAQGVPPQLLADQQKALKAATKGYLASLDHDELAALAAAQGFEHPTLVGLNSGEGAAHPLVHWLDPAYGPETPSKLAIQAKAAERYGALAAGETIGGLTLADVQVAEAQLGPPPALPPGSWAASPADVVAAQAALQDALVAFQPTGYQPSGSGLGAVVAAENHLATASCPELGPGLDAAKGAGRAAVDKALGTQATPKVRADIAALAEAAHADGKLSPAEAKYLSAPNQLALLRASTPASEREGLVALATQREEAVATLAAATEAYHGQLAGDHVGLEGTAGLVGFASSAAHYFEARKAVVTWGHTVAGSKDVVALTGQLWSPKTSPEALTTEFRAWAKSQKLADLREVATSMGFATSAGASRAEVQNFIAARWDPSLDQSKIAAAVAAKAQAKAIAPPAAPSPPPTKAPAAKPTPSPTSTAAPAPATAAVVPSAKSFAAKHLAIVESLKAHQAVAADLPPRPPASEVAAWSFGPAQASNLGGGHTKTLHAAPDGSMWMFKPDKTNGGARAHAEAQASEIFARVGVPSVAVYARSVGGKVGSIQPLVKGATPLSADPKSWSQADVDNLVRYHVAAWAVGDHDGGPANIIRTPSGGLCPVDQGQAFKFYGRDRLALDYHPNSSYGSVPVFHQAYAASKSGTLAKGVAVRPEAALPTIKAFEAMPESQYRALLAPVAAEGAAKGVHWVEPMRKAAQKRLGKAQVSDADVAEEFLRHAVERKNGLRAAFASFFTTNGFGSGAKLEKVA